MDHESPHAAAHRQDRIEASNGRSFSAYVALPAKPNGRAIIIGQEIFGVTHDIREVADRYARAGYLAVAPDLFWRVSPGIELSHSKEGIARAFELLQGFSEDDAIEDIGRTIAHAKAQPGIGSCAVLGMCLGGKLTYLAAARLPAEVCIAFYGVGIEKSLGEASDISRPLKMFFGTKDKYAPLPVQAQIAEATRGLANVEITVVEGADHGFYTRGAPEVISRTHEEALGFLDKHMPASRAQGAN
jgi:carboxymethylenebutenolidase